jgi:hypothetical protein
MMVSPSFCASDVFPCADKLYDLYLNCKTPPCEIHDPCLLQLLDAGFPTSTTTIPRCDNKDAVFLRDRNEIKLHKSEPRRFKLAPAPWEGLKQRQGAGLLVRPKELTIRLVPALPPLKDRCYNELQNKLNKCDFADEDSCELSNACQEQEWKEKTINPLSENTREKIHVLALNNLRLIAETDKPEDFQWIKSSLHSLLSQTVLDSLEYSDSLFSIDEEFAKNVIGGLERLNNVLWARVPFYKKLWIPRRATDVIYGEKF